MLSARFKPWHVPLFLAKYAWLTVNRRPISVQFEVTLRCNAKCGFCDYWKTPGEATLPVSRWSRPMTIGARSSPRATRSLIATPNFARAP